MRASPPKMFYGPPMGDKVSPNGLPPATTVSEWGVTGWAVSWMVGLRCCSGFGWSVGFAADAVVTGLVRMLISLNEYLLLTSPISFRRGAGGEAACSYLPCFWGHKDFVDELLPMSLSHQDLSLTSPISFDGGAGGEAVFSYLLQPWGS